MVTGSAGFFHAFRMSLIRLTTEIDDACQVSGTRARTSRKRGVLLFASYAAVWLRLHPSFQPWNLRNNGGQ